MVPGGLALFHDARVFEGGLPNTDYGPVRAVNELFRYGQLPNWRIVDEVNLLVVLEPAEQETAGIKFEERDFHFVLQTTPAIGRDRSVRT